MKILYVNSCVREESRTNFLAKYLLNKLDGEIEEVNLNKVDIQPLNANFLKQRDELINTQNFNSSNFDFAKQFSQADEIVISAPFWDLSFPSLLKIYFENINVLGITFKYAENGEVISLCKAKKMYYITTSGGPIYSDDYGYGYVKALAKTFYGVNEVQYIKAQGLDIYGASVDEILNKAKTDIDKILN